MRKLFIGMIVLGVAFAILRMAVVALIVVLMIALLLAFITRPRETLTYVLSLGLCSLISARPVACIVALGIITLVVVAIGALRRRSNQLPVTDDRSAAPRIPYA